MGRPSRLGGGLNGFGFSANPFFALGNRRFGALPNFLRLVIQIIQPFMAAASNFLAHFFPGAGRRVAGSPPNSSSETNARGLGESYTSRRQADHSGAMEGCVFSIR